MFNGGLTTEIKLYDDRQFYTNGDLVTGELVLQTSKSLSVRNVQITLRCEEFASVWVPTGQGGYCETSMTRHLQNTGTLFPSESVVNAQGKDACYTINQGTHVFPFCFQIPLNPRLPQTIHITGAKSNIRWYLKGVVHRGQVLAVTKRVVTEFEMRPSVPITVCEGIDCQSSESSMMCYLPGYAAQLKTPSGRLKDLLPNSSFKQRVPVTLRFGVPSMGILQSPEKLSALIEIESSMNELLLVRRFELELKAKYIVRVCSATKRPANATYSTAVRESVILVDMRVINLPLKEGLNEIQNKINETLIEGRLPGSFKSQYMELTYELMATVILASIENTEAVEKLRVCLPVRLHHVRHTEEVDDLPAYCETPMVGEFTFKQSVSEESVSEPSVSEPSGQRV